MTRVILVSLLAASAVIAADDPVLVELEKEKTSHAKEVRTLRQQLLDDIDKIIKQTHDMGGGIDYMLRERKGFVENGTPPILPKLKRVSEDYVEAKNAADTVLERAYTTAIEKSLKDGKLNQLASLKAELKKFRDSRPAVSDPVVQVPMPTPKYPPKEGNIPKEGNTPKLTGREPKPVPTSREPKPGEEREFEIARGVSLKFCWIPAGEAQLGSPRSEQIHMAKNYFTGEPPSHIDGEGEVFRGKFKTKGFWLGKYEVTQKEWETVMGSNPSNFKGVRLPVEQVSWSDCQGFVKNCRVEGMTVQLPHEDEWEYACRGNKGNKQPFYWGNELNGEKANCVGTKPYGKIANGDNLQRTTLVGSYEAVAPHPWGLCDMHGNVWEWCDNLYSAGTLEKSLRGGGWDSTTGLCRSAWRSKALPSAKNTNLGFRVALVPSLTPQP